MRRPSKGLLFALLLLVPILSGCADEPANEAVIEEPVEEPAIEQPSTDTMASAAAGATVTVTQMEPYGQYLADADGRALYLFVADADAEGSTCYDACAEAWPPFLASEGSPMARGAAQEALLGTIERNDGTMQVTYNGWPLYYFVQDQGANQPQGQDVMGFGAEWYLLTPQGEEVHAEGGESS